MQDASPEMLSLFCAALERSSADARAAYLDAACGNDVGLRARLEALLRAHEQAGGFLRGDPGDTDPGATADEPGSEGPGTLIGPYKLLEQIGEGGFGVVFLAEQQRPVRRKVALKVLKPGMDTRQVVARFEAERQALALMDHPNIAHVFDGGATPSGRPYFVMELVKGVPITAYCDQNRLTPRQRLELFVPVCQAVQHAHQKGIIHRDLKPSNVLVARGDDRPVPKVIDFGVAKAVSQPLTERTLMTGFGAVVGTPEYMSPEQASLNNVDIDTRSDIYALGVLLYELLTGSPPFPRRELEKAGLMELLRVIREQDPPKPSARLSAAEGLPTLAANRGTEPKKLIALLRGEMDWIAMKALEKDRAQRYETAGGFARDIERYLADEPVQACPPSAAYRLRKFGRRHKGALASAVLVVAALIGGTLISTWQAVEATRARNDADCQRKRAGKNLQMALAAVDRMLTRVGEKRLAMVPQMEEERQGLLEDALQLCRELLREESSDPQVRQEMARAYQRTARIYQLLGKGEQAEQAYAQALAIQRDLARQFPDESDYVHDQGDSHQQLGSLLRKLGDWDRAEQSYQQALTLLRALRKKHPEVADYARGLAGAYNGLGELYQDTTGRDGDAEAAFQQALAIRRELLDRQGNAADVQSDLARTYRSLGLLYRVMGDKPRAQEHLETALSHCKELASRHPEVPAYRSELAAAYKQCSFTYREAGDDAGRAEIASRKALELRDQLAQDHPRILEYQNDLASAYFELGAHHRIITRRQGEARAALHKGQEIEERLHRDHPRELVFALELARIYSEMGVSVRESGQFEAAPEPTHLIVQGLGAQAMAPAGVPLGSMVQVLVAYNVAASDALALEEALAWYGRHMSVMEELLQREPQHVEAREMLSSTYMNRAETFVRQGRRSEAVHDWKRMVDLGEGQKRAELRVNRAMALAQLGDHARATAEVEDMLKGGSVPFYSHYNFVCVFSLSVRAVRDDAALFQAQRDELAKKYGAEAVKLLGRMKADRFFGSSGVVEYMKNDTDLDPLLERADYKKRLLELEREAAARK